MKKEIDKGLIKEIIMFVTIVSALIIFLKGNSSEPQRIPYEGEERQNSETGAYEVYYEGDWIDERAYEQIIDKIERENENAWEYEPIYFLTNGYYYHSSKDCKGLKGYDNIEEDIFGNISEYKNLDACNWCN